jgi:hypothetical protein
MTDSDFARQWLGIDARLQIHELAHIAPNGKGSVSIKNRNAC